MSKAIDAVLQVLSRRNPMDDRDLMTPPTAFSVEMARQAAKDVARLRSLLVEARDALLSVDRDLPREARSMARALRARLDAEVGRG